MNNACKALLFAALTLCGPALASRNDASLPAARPTHFAQAQTQKDEPLVSSARTINLTEENRYLIREIVLKDPKVKKEFRPTRCDRRSGTARCCDRAVPGRTIGEGPGAALAPVFCGRRRGRRCRPQDQQGRRHRQTDQLKAHPWRPAPPSCPRLSRASTSLQPRNAMKTWMAGTGHPARLRAGTPTSPAMTQNMWLYSSLRLTRSSRVSCSGNSGLSNGTLVCAAIAARARSRSAGSLATAATSLSMR